MQSRELCKFHNQPVRVWNCDSYLDPYEMWDLTGRPPGDLRPEKFLDAAVTRRRIDRLSAQGITPIIREGSRTLVYKTLARNYAEDLSLEFWELISRYLFGESSSPAIPARLSHEEALLQSVNLLVEHKRQLVDHERRIGVIEQVHDSARRELSTLAIAGTIAPPLTLRDDVRRIINNFAAFSGTGQQELYARAYRDFYYRARHNGRHVNIQSRAASSGKRSIDVIEQLGLMEQFHGLVVELYGHPPDAAMEAAAF